MPTKSDCAISSKKAHYIFEEKAFRKKMGYKKGDWYIFCDICGQRHYASKTEKLSTYTGHGGAIVCRHDTDAIDYGLVPFTPRKEANVDTVRINHTNTDDAAPLVDSESMTYIYYLAASQDNSILMASQDDAWIQINEPI